MPRTRPITDPLRDALNARIEAGDTVRIVATVCGIDFRTLLAFSQGGPPEFSADSVDRLAEYLRLQLTISAKPRLRS
jgi:hypothetical protein